MPKQNRPLVRDGRLQQPKKRTDRSYLSPRQPAVAEPATEEIASDEGLVAEAFAEEPAPVASGTYRVPAAVRAIQQQGVRRRREVDVQALAVRDTKYALHELRRIAVLATIVIVTLIVLGIILR